MEEGILGRLGAAPQLADTEQATGRIGGDALREKLPEVVLAAVTLALGCMLTCGLYRGIESYLIMGL